MMTFGPLRDDSEDAATLRTLLLRDDIWEPQRYDGSDKAVAAKANFGEGCYLAVFRNEVEPIGYILFTPFSGAGNYQQHTAFIEFERGFPAMRMIEWAINKLFVETNAVHLITTCPEWHPASSAMARRMGGQFRYVIDHFAMRDGKKYGATVFGMTIQEWAYKNHSAFAEIGHRWHEQVFAHLPPHHDEDPAHDGFLGISIKVGERRPQIGLWIYNAWAEIAGYAQSTLIWADGKGNSVIDIGDAVVVNLPEGKVAAVFPKCPPLQPSEPS